MRSEEKKEYLRNLKSFIITTSPFLLAIFALFINLPIEYANLRIFLIWLSLELSSLICFIRNEIPRLYPYNSIKGKQAKALSLFALIFWSVLGISGFVAKIYESYYIEM